MKYNRILIVAGVWLNWWANNNENGGAPNLGYWLGIFGLMNFMTGLLMVGAVALVQSRCWLLSRSTWMLNISRFLWIVMIPRSGKNLHKSILDAVMRLVFHGHGGFGVD